MPVVATADCLSGKEEDAGVSCERWDREGVGQEEERHKQRTSSRRPLGQSQTVNCEGWVSSVERLGKDTSDKQLLDLGSRQLWMTSFYLTTFENEIVPQRGPTEL